SLVDGVATPDTLVGSDSHTTMVNGLGLLGWGVGGIEAEAAMLGQPMLLPAPVVIGIRAVGTLPPGSTAPDRVRTRPAMTRERGAQAAAGSRAVVGRVGLVPGGVPQPRGTGSEGGRDRAVHGGRRQHAGGHDPGRRGRDR